jgi:hypothetical protein
MEAYFRDHQVPDFNMSASPLYLNGDTVLTAVLAPRSNTLAMTEKFWPCLNAAFLESRTTSSIYGRFGYAT